ncbi:hypothetical protein Tco_1232350 [Tanacetum coccineum]
MVMESLEHALLTKDSSQPQSSYKAVASLTEFKLKKILINKMDKSESYLAAPEHRECYDGLVKSYELDKTFFSTYDKESKSGSSKGTKSQSTSSCKSVQEEEPEFEVADTDMTQDQEGNMGNDDEEPKRKVASKRDWFTKPKQPQEPTDPDIKARLYNKDQLKDGPAFKLLKGTHTNFIELEYDFEECYKAILKKLDWENPKGGDYPFDLTKPLPLVKIRNRQKVPVDYFFNNDLKYLQGGISTMTYTTSLTKKKAAQHDLLEIKDMVPNIWSPVKVAFDKHALWGISHWREQLTRVEVMKKHGYGYLREIEVQRADNNMLTNLSGDDVVDFAIALRMFTRSLVIQKRVKDLQLGVKSYQKKINVTKPETTRSSIRKRDPYTPYQDPQ